MKSLLLAAAILMSGCATTIGPGQVGVLWRASGGTQPQTYGEGLEHVAPWNEMYVYDLRAMTHDEVLNVIAVNGLAIQLDASVRYRVIPAEVVALQEEVGPDYYKTILEPVLRSEARRVIGRYTPEEIYSTKRDVVEREIREQLVQKLTGKHLDLEAVLIRNVELPPAIRQAIDQKLAAEQEVLKMNYVLQVAKARADEQRIEAQGVADYNKIVSSSITPSILQFEQVQQLDKLAASPNAKTVVLGPGAAAPNLMLSPEAKGAPTTR